VQPDGLDVQTGVGDTYNERLSLPIVARSRSALCVLVLVTKQLTLVGVTGLGD